ncbi:hypothetical protein FRC03_001933 [Tulasnella sp. 419]|nr:hypothetical protein FRC03_001933 [Tulasnella sp. 419]
MHRITFFSRQVKCLRPTVGFNRKFTSSLLAADKNGSRKQELDLDEQLERDASRILRVVQKRVEERERLLKEESFRQATDLLNDPDPDMQALASIERQTQSEVLTEHAYKTFPSLLVPPSPTAHMSALIEMKSGAGGDEASLFVGEVMRMYTRLGTTSGMKSEVLSMNVGEGGKGSSGAVKDSIMEIKGEGAYDLFRWESGVHRVQRVPATETSGRAHTSTISVIVLPTSEENSSESDMDIHIDEKDVKTEVMRARGAGGQHVNKTESAVRLTHIPTGITVSMQDSRSQHSNRAKAWQILRARLLDRKMAEEAQKRRDTRKNLVKSSDRSEKIRTYNFAQVQYSLFYALHQCSTLLIRSLRIE